MTETDGAKRTPPTPQDITKISGIGHSFTISKLLMSALETGVFTALAESADGSESVKNVIEAPQGSGFAQVSGRQITGHRNQPAIPGRYGVM
jgi:hypothetical protein